MQQDFHAIRDTSFLQLSRGSNKTDQDPRNLKSAPKHAKSMLIRRDPRALQATVVAGEGVAMRADEEGRRQHIHRRKMRSRVKRFGLGWVNGLYHLTRKE
jgi:hypothetical protein